MQGQRVTRVRESVFVPKSAGELYIRNVRGVEKNYFRFGLIPKSGGASLRNRGVFVPLSNRKFAKHFVVSPAGRGVGSCRAWGEF